MKKFHPLLFSFQSVIKVILLHDIEKPFKYTDNGRQVLIKENIGTADEKILKYIINKYKLSLTSEEENGINYIH